MRLCTRPACALLLAAATVASGLVLAPAASADTGDITIISVSSPPHNAGLITVQTMSPTAIVPGSITVHLLSGSADVSVTGFVPILNGGPEEIWQLPDPITTQQLPLGTYTATVDAADSSGLQTGLPGGTFPFLIQPSVTLIASPPAISYAQQTVQFSGQATEVIPGAISPVPDQDQTLQIVGPLTPGNPTGSYTATTDSKGNFQISVKPQPGTYYAVIPSTQSMASARSSPLAVAASSTPIRLAAGFAQNTIEFGRTDAITGTVSYQSGTMLKPLPHTTVTIARLSFPGQPEITVQTGPDGDFRAAIPRQTATGTWAVTAGGTALLGRALVTRTLTVHQTTGFKRTSIELSAGGVLTIKSCVVDTSPGRSGEPVNAPVALEYGPRARGPWKQFVTIEPTYGVPYCPGRSPVWAITVKAPAQNAYYRLRFAGTQTLRVSVSKVAHLWRDDTRITSFKVSPHHVHAKGVITVSGRLWRAATTRPADSSSRSGDWTPYADRKVAILFIYHGQEFAFTPEPKTNSSGYFSGLFTVYVTARWLAKFKGNKTHFASTSATVKVTVG